jgi:hypothetical protein
MLSVLMLFLIPVGGRITAGVLLAQTKGLAWPVTAGFYLVSDMMLALGDQRGRCALHGLTLNFGQDGR